MRFVLEHFVVLYTKIITTDETTVCWPSIELTPPIGTYFSIKKNTAIFNKLLNVLIDDHNVYTC